MPTLTAFFESAKLPVMTEVAHSLVRTLNDPDATAAQMARPLLPRTRR